MNILVIHQYFLEKNGAGGSRFNQFVKYWSRAGHKVTVIAGTVDYATGQKNKKYKRKWIAKEKIDKRITILRCYVSQAYNKNFLGRLWAYLSFTLSATWAGLFYAKKQKIIIDSSPPLFVAIPGYLISRIKRVPLIFEIRDLWPKFAIDTGVLKNPLLIKFSYWLENFIYQKTDLINVLTPAFQEHLLKEKKIPASKIVYIPNGADLDLMRPGPKNNWVRKKYNWLNKFIILYIGAHGVANDLWQILDVAAMFKNNSRLLFVLVGDGMEKPQLQAYAQKQNLTNAQFLDPVPKEKIIDFINAADLCVAVLQPVFTTTYPNKIFDYMACAKPIILPIDGICRKLVVDEAQAGIFTKPKDKNDFKEKIFYACTHLEEIKKMGISGYDFVKNNFDRQKLADKYLKNIINVVNNYAHPIS